MFARAEEDQARSAGHISTVERADMYKKIQEKEWLIVKLAKKKNAYAKPGTSACVGLSGSAKNAGKRVYT